MHSPISPLVANLFMEDSKARTLSTAPSPTASGLGMWMTPLLSTRKNTPNRSSPTLIPSTPYTVQNRGSQPTRILSLHGHISFSRLQWSTSHHSLQEIHTHRPLSTFGQSTQHLCQIQCCQHPHK